MSTLLMSLWCATLKPRIVFPKSVPPYPASPLASAKRGVFRVPSPHRRWFMWFLFRRDITVSAPADTAPIGDLLIEGWAYRKTCIDAGDCMGMLTWVTAFDALLDRLLSERPDFAIYSAGLVAA